MNYLIVKTSSIGDIVQTFPVVQYLKTREPACLVHWVVEEEYAPLVRAHPGVDEVLTVTTRQWRLGKALKGFAHAVSALRRREYDVVFDLQGNIKSGVVAWLARGKEKVGFARGSVAEWPNCLFTTRRYAVPSHLQVQRYYLSLIEQFFEEKNPFQPQPLMLMLSDQERATFETLTQAGTPRVMVAFASRWENKTLSFEAWVDVLKGVQGPFYFVSGGGKDTEIAEKLAALFPGSRAIEKLPFPVWQRLIGHMEFVLAVDSAALALCGLSHTPTFSFFGPTHPSVYKPLGMHHRHFQGACPYGVQFTRRCPRLRTCPTGGCLKALKTPQLPVVSSDGCDRG